MKFSHSCQTLNTYQNLNKRIGAATVVAAACWFALADHTAAATPYHEEAQEAPSATASQSSESAVANYLAAFQGECYRLEAMDEKGVREIIKLQRAGYFATFCRTFAFQTCADFSEAVKTWGTLVPAKRPQSCRFQDNPPRESIVGID